MSNYDETQDQKAYIYNGYLIIDTNQTGEERFECYERIMLGWTRFDSANTLSRAQIYCDHNGRANSPNYSH